MEAEIEEILLPEDKDSLTEEELFRKIEELKEKLESKRFSTTLFTMVIDSQRNKGKICKLIGGKEEEEIIPDFVFKR